MAKDTLMRPQALTPREAAQALRVGQTKLYEMLKDGTLRSVVLGKCRRIPASEIDRLLAVEPRDAA